MPSWQPKWLVLQFDLEGRVCRRQYVLTLDAARQLKLEWDAEEERWATYLFEE